MEETPIPKQQGLSQEDFDKMKPVSQEYKWDSPSLYPEEHQTSLNVGLGISTQQSNLKHALKKCLVLYDKDRASIDSKKEYELDRCLKTFSNNLADTIVSIIHAQKIMIQTPVSTVDTITSGILTSIDKNFTFVGAGNGNGTEVADTIGTGTIDID